MKHNRKKCDGVLIFRFLENFIYLFRKYFLILIRKERTVKLNQKRNINANQGDRDMEAKKEYANHLGWSDINPYEILSSTPKTITIRAMKAELDPTWKPEWIPGGFAGCCVNQNEQKWIYESDENQKPIRAYLRKDGYYYSQRGKHSICDQPVKFRDYNF